MIFKKIKSFYTCKTLLIWEVVIGRLKKGNGEPRI